VTELPFDDALGFYTNTIRFRRGAFKGLDLNVHQSGTFGVRLHGVTFRYRGGRGICFLGALVSGKSFTCFLAAGSVFHFDGGSTKGCAISSHDGYGAGGVACS